MIAVDRYMLDRELATGGMATVWLGRVRGAVGFARVVAVKRLHPQFARDPEFVAMLLDEARIASRIRHHNVVPTLDVVSSGNEIFLVMEYVHGESLSSVCKHLSKSGARLPLPIAVAIMCDMLRGLHAAHEACDEGGQPLELVHRDVSPQNVLVGADGVSRVADFGVSKASGRMQSTSDGQVKGKAGYMSPEQLQGSVDRRADVYAAGVVLWELVTGKRLFSGESHAEVIAKVLVHDVPLPSSLAELPGAIEEIIACALERNAADRFATAREMERALSRAQRPADAAEVAEWLATTMKTSLAEKAALVTAVEQEAELPSTSKNHEMPTTPLASASARTPSLGRSRSRWIAGVLIGACGIAAAADVLVRSSSHHSSNVAVAPEASAVHSAVAAGVSAQPIVTNAAPDASSVPNVAHVGASQPHSPHPIPTLSSHPKSPKRSCTPPYYFDSQGFQRWYPECL